MAIVIITFKIMPENPEIKMEDLKESIIKEISNFGGEVGKSEEVPIGFGLSSLNLIFTMDESKGSTDVLEETIKKIEGVGNVEVIDIRRAIG